MSPTHANGPIPRPAVLRIAPYVPGRSKVVGPERQYRLAANENALGPSEAAREAFHAAAGLLGRYPDGSAALLREAIASAYGLNPARIICGNGSDEVLSMIAQAYLEEGDEAIFTEHGFLVYRIVTLAAGATPVVARETNLTADVDAILDCVTPATKVVFLANPNNPTGTYVTTSEVKRLRESLPEGVLLVLDAAYAEYVRRNDYEAGIELVANRDDTIMTRTFSKIHGLAALRLGWAYAPEGVIDALHRVRGPFNINAPAIEAGVAAMGDKAHLAASVAHNDRWLPEVTRRLSALGFSLTPSVGNFALIGFDQVPGADALAADEALSAQGVILRSVASYGLPQHLRMTIGEEEGNEAAINALTAYRNRL